MGSSLKVPILRPRQDDRTTLTARVRWERVRRWRYRQLKKRVTRRAGKTKSEERKVERCEGLRGGGVGAAPSKPWSAKVKMNGRGGGSRGEMRKTLGVGGSG